LLAAGPREGLEAGDRVRWRGADDELPEGTAGIVLGFRGASDNVAVTFDERGKFAFSSEQLILLERRTPRSDDPHSDSDDSDGAFGGPTASPRPPCYPFQGDCEIEVDGGKVHVASSETEPDIPPIGIVVFCPGTHGGVGPCRTPGSSYCPNALFPTLASMLKTEGICCYRVCWSAMHPPLDEAIQGTLRVVLRALERIGGRAPSGRKVGICLVGHSLGGAVVLATSHLLSQMLPDINASGEGAPAGQELLGVCTLAAQESGSIASVQRLTAPGVRKLFLHGSADAVLPWQIVERIHDAATEPKEFCVLPGGEHDLYGFRGHLLGKVSAFLTDALHRRRWRRSESRGGMHMDELAAQLAHSARDPLVASLSCVAPEASAAASVAPSLSSAQYCTPADYEYLYYSGEVVRLCGLRADHLNGLSAKVVSYEASSRRCGVEVLATKRRIAVKMTNLRQWVYDADFPDVCAVCHEMLNFCAVPPCACACVWPPPLVAMESSDTKVHC